MKAYFVDDHQIGLVQPLNLFPASWGYLLGFEGMDQLIHVTKDSFVASIDGGNPQGHGRVGLALDKDLHNGKTYLVSAFGNAACRKNLKVRSYRVNRLLTDLAIGRGMVLTTGYSMI